MELKRLQDATTCSVDAGINFVLSVGTYTREVNQYAKVVVGLIEYYFKQLERFKRL